MFDVGFTEILLLSLVGLLVLGPERLPRVARTLGGLARKARSSWAESQAIQSRLNFAPKTSKNRSSISRKEIKSTVDKVRSGVDSLKDIEDLRSGRAGYRPAVNPKKQMNPMTGN